MTERSSPALQAYLSGLDELHRAHAAAGGELPEADEDSILEKLDILWNALSEEEQARADARDRDKEAKEKP